MVYADRDEAVKVVTSKEMRGIDRVAIENYGIPGLVLMERAGIAVARRALDLYPDKRFLVICGAGNNGGDGLVAARELHNRGVKVTAVIVSNKNSLSNDCASQYKTALKFGVAIEFKTSLTSKDLHGSVVIDAVFGTGLSRPVQGNIAKIFDFVNSSDAAVVSVDIPSGISSDTGDVLGEAIKADFTVTFGLPKIGHFLYPGAEYTGRLFVEDIGFPAKLLASKKINVDLINRELVSGLIPPRHGYSHKGDYGHVLVIAGSKGKTGAALMAAKACLRSGSGLVTLAVPESLMDVFQGRVTEEMTLPLPDDGSGMLSSKAIDVILNFAAKKIDVIVTGPGIGVSNDTEKIMNELIQKSTIPMVIDADAINSISRATGNRQRAIGLFKKAKSPIILTPHTGEMARLIQDARRNPPFSKGERGRINGVIQEIEKNRINTAMSFSKETGTCLILKGVPTIIAEPDGNAFINTTGNSGMATAGSGDVLTGVIASLLGQGLNPLDASLLGVYLHGLAGDAAAREKGEHSLIASDIIDFLAEAFMQTIDSNP